LPFVPNYAYQRIPRYRTTLVQASSGRTEALAHWAYPLHEFVLPLNGRKQNELEHILRYFHAAAGRAATFNFVDFYEDRSCSLGQEPAFDDVVIGTATDGQISFQLHKTYITGSVIRSRKITRPIDDSVLIGVDGVAQSPSAFSVGDGGVVTFSNELDAGQVVTAGFRFAVPVRFGSDEIEQTIHNYVAGFVGDATVTLMEDRE
jgi:uncharacterized protein (TIGR02217 family)